MEPGTRWTLAVVGLAVGAGFGLVHQVWRASSTDTALPAAGPAPAGQAVPDARSVWHGYPQGPLSAPTPGRLPAVGSGGDRSVAGYAGHGIGGERFQGWAPAPEPAYRAYPPGPAYPTYPTERAYQGHPTALAYPAWDGYPQARYGGYPPGPGGYEPGYPAYPPAAYPDYPEVDGTSWWGPEFHDGPPPPGPEALADPPGPPQAAGYAEDVAAARTVPEEAPVGAPPEPPAESGVMTSGSPPDWDVVPPPVPVGAETPAGTDEPAAPQPLAGSSLDPGPPPPEP